MRKMSFLVIVLALCSFSRFALPTAFALPDVEGTVWKGVSRLNGQLNNRVTFEFEVGGGFTSTHTFISNHAPETYAGEWKQEGNTVTVNIPKQKDTEGWTWVLTVAGDKMDGSVRGGSESTVSLKKVSG